MSQIPRFLIAKYVPDPRRMEPRNIGVVLWTKRAVATRFMPHDQVDGLQDIANYNRWIDYWNTQAQSDPMHPPRGEAVKRSSPEFLDVFMLSQEGSYQLHDVGEMLEAVSVRDVGAAVDQLYRDLVDGPRNRQGETPSDAFSEACESVLDESGLTDRSGFCSPCSLPMSVFGVDRPVHFDYGLLPGESPQALFRQVRLRSAQSVESGAFAWECVKKSRTVTAKERCISLVFTSGEDQGKGPISQNIAVLQHFSNVIDLRDRARAVAMIKKAVA
jgi:hypothetical protein